MHISVHTACSRDEGRTLTKHEEQSQKSQKMQFIGHSHDEFILQGNIRCCQTMSEYCMMQCTAQEIVECMYPCLH